MNEFFDAVLGLLSGLFGILLGLAYFMPLVLILVAVVIALYLRERRGRKTVFSGEEPGKEGKHRD
ncbi:hypothetical protein D3C87_1032120 [compost metagenome]